MAITQVTFNPALWSAGNGVGTVPGDNGYNAANVWLDKDGVTAWAFEYFGAGFARFNLSNGSIIHQDATFGVPGFGGQLWYTRESVGNFWQQDNSGNYYTILFNSAGSPSYPTLYKFQIGAGSAGNILNGYSTDPTTFTLGTMTPAPGSFNQFEDGRIFTSGGTVYCALIQERNPGVMYIINATTMAFVGSYTNTGHGRGWQVFQDSTGDIWGVFTDPNFSATTIDLVRWHPADGATAGVLNFTTGGTGLHTVATGGAFSSAFFAFATYVSSNNSLWLGSGVSQTGPVVNIDLGTFTVTATQVDDLVYFENGILDDAQSAMDNGVVGGVLAIPGDILSGGVPSTAQEGGIAHLVDPISLALLSSTNITLAINGQGGLTPIPTQNIGGRGPNCLPPPGTFQWNGTQLVVAYEFIGSPVYIVPLTAPVVGTATTTAMVAAPNPQNLGNSILLTATVTPNSGILVPTGTVQFKDGVSNLGSPQTLNGSGIATLSHTFTLGANVGVHPFTAVYLPTGSFLTSTSTTFNETISPYVTSTVVLSSLAPSFFEDDVTFTATVVGTPTGPSAPTGTVQFFDGVNSLGTSPLVAISGTASQATFETTALSVGVHSISGVYSGDLGVLYNPSTSGALLQQVQPQVFPQNVLTAFSLQATFSPNGDTNLPPQAALQAVPQSTHAHTSITLLWNTVNVGQVQITGNNGIDPPFNSGLLATSGNGAFIVGNGFTATITLILNCFDKVGAPLPVSAQTTITIS